MQSYTGKNATSYMFTKAAQVKFHCTHVQKSLCYCMHMKDREGGRAVDENEKQKTVIQVSSSFQKKCKIALF